MERDFKGRNALVTGSAKRLGKAMALALAANGCNVGVHYLHSRKEALEVKREAESFGVKSEIFRADVTDDKQCRKLVYAFVKKFGSIDFLVNNVGSFIRKPLDQFEPGEWREMIDSNLNSAYYCSKYALEFMRVRKSGGIINIGSAGAERVQANVTTTAYYAAKTGVLLLTKTMALMEALNGIRVNAISPGILVNSVVKHPVPIGNYGRLEDVTNAMLFLLSEKARHVTGANLEVAGGYRL